MTQQLSAGIGGGDLDTKAAPGTRLGDARQEDMLQKAAAKKAIEKSDTAIVKEKQGSGKNIQEGIKTFMSGWIAAQKAKALEIENREAESRSVVADTLRLSERSARARGESFGSLNSAMQGFFK